MKIRKLLREKTRYERETGQKYSPKEDFLSKITIHETEYAFTMVRIPKVGLNPKTDYNTPAGVYFYPLTKKYYEMLIENYLPFATNSPYCGLVKLNWSDKKKWLIFDNAGGSNQDEAAFDKAYADLEPMYKKYFQDEPQVYRNLDYKTATLGNHYRNYGVDGKIFDLTFFAANQLASKAGKKVTIMWTSILRDLGYIGLYDYGAGVIHPSEQTQLVCLEPSAYETIRVYETKDLRRGTNAEKQEIEFRRQQREIKQNQIKFWNEFLSRPVEERVYATNEQVFYSRDFTDLGFPISKLGGTTFNCSVVFDFLVYKGERKVPDNITATGGISIVAAEEMGKNITCRRLIIKDGIKKITEGMNIKTVTLRIDNSSNLITIPSDIEFKNLDIAGGEFSYLPNNLTVPGSLSIDNAVMKKLPNGLSVGGDLDIYQMFKDIIDSEEFIRIFPDDLQVGGKVRGYFPPEMFGWESEWDLDEVKKIIANTRQELSQTQPLKEVYNRWKRLI